LQEDSVLQSRSGILSSDASIGNALRQVQFLACHHLPVNGILFRGPKHRDAKFQNVCICGYPLVIRLFMHLLASSYDATHDVVAQVTYELPAFTSSITGPPPRISEDAFLASIINPHLGNTVGDGAPVEPFLHKELSNPHSRAKKLKRFKEYQIRIKAMRKEMLTYEVKHLNGRSPQEARAEALFKWRSMLKTERQERKKMRWKHKNEMANLERKAARKARKELQQRHALTALELEEGKNQVIPTYA